MRFRDTKCGWGEISAFSHSTGTAKNQIPGRAAGSASGKDLSLGGQDSGNWVFIEGFIEVFIEMFIEVFILITEFSKRVHWYVAFVVFVLFCFLEHCIAYCFTGSILAQTN